MFDDDIDDCEFSTCDYCGEPAEECPAIWDKRTQLAVCGYCVNTHGREAMQEWLDSLPDLPT